MNPAISIPASAVGFSMPPAPYQASARALMCYAAALNAQEGIYLDDSHPGGLAGLPPFTVVPEWRVMNGQPYRQRLGLDDAAMWKCLHVQQDSFFYQPFRAGMPLETVGTIVQLKQTRIGVYVAVRLRTHVRASTPADTRASAVAESWFCGIFLDATLDGPDTMLEAAPLLPAFRAEQPTTHELLHVDRTLPHLYTAAADIWNPIHTERLAAHQAGLSDILLHGTCTWATAGLHLLRRYADGAPAKLTRLGARMAGKVAVGAQLFIQYSTPSPLPDNVMSVSFQVINQHGEIVLADGLAEFAAAKAAT